MSNIVRHYSEGVLGRGPSPALWGDLSKVQDDSRFGKCGLIFDDFVQAPFLTGATNTTGTLLYANDDVDGQSDRYYYYADIGVQLKGPTAAPNLSNAFGELEISGNDADNDEGHVQFGSGNPFRIDNGSGNTGEVYFEARIKTASIANDGCSFFVGLGTGPVAENYLVDDTGALIATKGFIGFRTLAAGGDVLEFIHQAASQTVNTVANAATLVADDYVKVGLRYQPNAVDPNKQIVYFVNGVEQATGISTTQIDAATFPEGEALAPMILTKVGTAAEVKVTCDWIAAAQYLDSAAAN